jgi:hypothetical protein
MKIKVLLATSALALAGAQTAGLAFGQTFDKRTVFTFNRPISLPGVTLPAGDYLFRIVNTETDRKVIQVLSGDGKTPYVMLHSIPDVRVEQSEKPAVRFMETAKGQPSAVKAWWYPGERIGYEFIYPKDQARRLAKEVREPVLTTVAETTKPEETSTAKLERITPTLETPVAVTPEPEPIVSSGIVQEGEIAEARTELPVTATDIPTLGALGLLALAVAGGLRLWRKVHA